MNQLYNQLNNQQQSLNVQSINNLKQTFQKVKMMANPMGYLNSIPEMKNVMGLINQNGGNAKDLFYQLAEQKGVNPDDVLDMFK